MAHDHSMPGVPAAKQFRAWACEHGTITIELIDGAGKTFATASFGRDVWQFMTQGVAADLRKHGLAAGETVQ